MESGALPRASSASAPQGEPSGALSTPLRPGSRRGPSCASSPNEHRQHGRRRGRDAPGRRPPRAPPAGPAASTLSATPVFARPQCGGEHRPNAPAPRPEMPKRQDRGTAGTPCASDDAGDPRRDQRAPLRALHERGMAHRGLLGARDGHRRRRQSGPCGWRSGSAPRARTSTRTPSSAESAAGSLPRSVLAAAHLRAARNAATRALVVDARVSQGKGPTCGCDVTASRRRASSGGRSSSARRPP